MDGTFKVFLQIGRAYVLAPNENPACIEVMAPLSLNPGYFTVKEPRIEEVAPLSNNSGYCAAAEQTPPTNQEMAPQNANQKRPQSSWKYSNIPTKRTKLDTTEHQPVFVTTSRNSQFRMKY